MQNFHIIILCQLGNHEYKDSRPQEVYLNHEDGHPRIKILSQCHRRCVNQTCGF
jgi:hypothetical protein